jgi:uncharacterized protein (TIGR03545 family)
VDEAMKNAIRWKAVIPTLIFILLVALFIIFFLDSVVKWAIVKAGQGIFGARVDIASVDMNLRRSSLAVRGMQVADKADPWKNLFEFSEAIFDARSLPLLEKKVVIDQASIRGLKFGTKRKTSGALPFEEKRPGFVGKAVDRLWSQVETVSIDKFESVKEYYDPKTVVNPDQLTSLKAADKAKTEIQKAPGEVKKQVDDLNAEQRVKDLQNRIEGLGKGGNDPAGALQKIEEAKSIQSDLSKLKSDIQTTRTSVLDRVKSAQSLVEDVKKAKEDDWKKIRETFSLPTLDKSALTRALFGPNVAHQIERILGWVQMGRRYMPAKPEAPPPPPRGRGRTIEFPRHNVLPRFLLVTSTVDGEVGQEKPFGFTGTIAGVTSNPVLYGKPATLNFHGTQGPRSFNLDAIIDHTHAQHLEKFDGQFRGFSLNNFSFGQSESLGLQLNKGIGAVSGSFSVQGDALSGQVDFKGSDIALTPKFDTKSDSEIAKRLTNSVTSSLRQVRQLTLGVGVGGTLAAPTFDIDSNVGGVVSGAIKNALGAEVALQEQKLRAELDRQTSAKIQELQQSVQGLQKDALGRLGANDKIVDELLSQVKAKIAGGVALPGGAGKGVDSIKGIFGR